MKGNAAAAILVTSYAVEIATKTLHAQTKPNEKPPNGHDLLYLATGTGFKRLLTASTSPGISSLTRLHNTLCLPFLRRLNCPCRASSFNTLTTEALVFVDALSQLRTSSGHQR